MHTYAISRGINKDTQKFIESVSKIYLPSPWKKIQDSHIQFAARPIQLWEFVYPEKYMPIVHRTIFPNGTGAPQHSKHQIYLTAMRLALGADKIPEFKVEGRKLPGVHTDNVEFNGIGIKPDRYEGEDEML